MNVPEVNDMNCQLTGNTIKYEIHKLECQNHGNSSTANEIDLMKHALEDATCSTQNIALFLHDIYTSTFWVRKFNVTKQRLLNT